MYQNLSLGMPGKARSLLKCKNTKGCSRRIHVFFYI